MDSQMKLLVVVAYLACLPLAHASPETDACDTRREALEQQMATALNQDGSAQLDSLQAQLMPTRKSATTTPSPTPEAIFATTMPNWHVPRKKARIN
jgi:hypothetical protein